MALELPANALEAFLVRRNKKKRECMAKKHAPGSCESCAVVVTSDQQVGNWLRMRQMYHCADRKLTAPTGQCMPGMDHTMRWKTMDQRVYAAVTCVSQTPLYEHTRLPGHDDLKGYGIVQVYFDITTMHALAMPSDGKFVSGWTHTPIRALL